MQKLLVIFFTSHLLLQTPLSDDFSVIFPDDYKKALYFMQANHNGLKNSAVKYKHSVELLSTVVFPEVMRYSLIKDFIETTGLEYIYITHGSTYADFSIGPFQMKPSFAEHLEQAVEDSDSLKNIYKSLTSYALSDKASVRALRIKRLKSLDWQLIYLNVFISATALKFKNERFNTLQDSLRFYASAYNTGLYKTAEAIKNSVSYNYFPYGKSYEGKQYAYSDVAVYFHEHVFLKHKIPITTP